MPLRAPLPHDAIDAVEHHGRVAPRVTAAARLGRQVLRQELVSLFEKR
jgi:hypothetical protein